MIPKCGFDGLDCCHFNYPLTFANIGDGECQTSLDIPECGYDDGDCRTEYYLSVKYDSSCNALTEYIGDGWYDDHRNNYGCGYDEGDCCFKEDEYSIVWSPCKNPFSGDLIFI